MRDDLLGLVQASGLLMGIRLRQPFVDGARNAGGDAGPLRSAAACGPTAAARGCPAWC